MYKYSLYTLKWINSLKQKHENVDHCHWYFQELEKNDSFRKLM